ncbi:hypothetical protein CPB85DRAFT_957713 [Mucidula mucida]|nr:hypothetical protein CPB85DRAFT_957713 [Mucidula mucida]
MPHVPSANTCDACDKHLNIIHGDTPKCAKCLPDGAKLQTCSRCQLARYCNAECQRANWSLHKTRCATSQKNLTIARALDVGKRHEDFVQWVKRSRRLRYLASSWALNIGTERDLSRESAHRLSPFG